jgi:hypothetical protein
MRSGARLVLVVACAGSVAAVVGFGLGDGDRAPRATETASVASGRLYWADNARGAILSAPLQRFGPARVLFDGIPSPAGVAVARGWVFWTNDAGAGTIGRASLDGSRDDPTFIQGTGNSQAVAVYGDRIYWTDVDLNSIARATLTGSRARLTFITGARHPRGLLIYAGHIYWSNHDDGSIGRAHLNGSHVNQRFITGLGAPGGLATDGRHLYWADELTGAIGRANLDGTGRDRGFLAHVHAGPGVAVAGGRIYWATETASGGSIARARLDGSHVELNDRPAGNGADGVAVGG